MPTKNICRIVPRANHIGSIHEADRNLLLGITKPPLLNLNGVYRRDFVTTRVFGTITTLPQYLLSR